MFTVFIFYNGGICLNTIFIYLVVFVTKPWCTKGHCVKTHDLSLRAMDSGKSKVPNGYDFIDECGKKGEGKVEPDCGNEIRKCCVEHCDESQDCVSKCTSESSNYCVGLCSSDKRY
jgi:hypothetical protein